ncbi:MULTISPECIES: DMT family transporter [Halocynthiibacter]|uniref:DMT family transporter n=1 Tax=Halocynthiibacter halioticoli TaxID=2986804 RepID=A0AAE3IXJ3_9RHOB|nr:MULTISPECIES: DMT family transporter [Halocynthiibacter]MCV6823839.1 DMT family transporter [Halocynthiibacter halioticoli]MCW4056840.1 DMT family transporter [Halocynthiibacter sp. SDUM655004]MDE0590142.1 DMT family transporter [Halocynthiibacter sp. C4]
MNYDRPYLGILLMLVFCVFAPLGDALSKLIGETSEVMQLVSIRFLAQVLILAPIVVLIGSKFRMRRRVLGFVVLRTVFHILGISTMFLALRYLPLADAVAIGFVMPFIMLFFGWLFLNEEVGPRRIIAAGIGFIGTLMVIQPSFEEVGAPALLPVGVALFFAAFMLVTRVIAREIEPIALQAVGGGIAVVILFPVWFIGNTAGWSGFEAHVPSGREFWLFVAVGLVGTTAHLFMTWALRFAPSATLAPMQYLEIPFATMIGFWLFSDWPNGLAAVGILITISSGLYVIFRERRLAAAATAAAVTASTRP